MIEHLRGREQALGPLGWTGRKAEWIALVCLHSGVFTRAQFCCYFNTQRMTALRFVKALIEQRAAEPGKVIEGLTIKQEISAIKEALHSDDEKFITQYGGMQGAVERYKELMTRPEAELVKGVSIDGYSTYRAARFSEPV